MTSRRRERDRTESSRTRSDDEDRPLKEREIVNLFMACGILENIARSILKNTPELSTLTTKNVEDMKAVVREALSVLTKEGVPQIKLTPSVPSGENKEGTQQKQRLTLCRVCKDSSVIKVQWPEKMGKYFRLEQKFHGRLTKDDWLCKSCYSDWYRDNRDWIAQNDKKDDLADDKVVDEPVNTEEEQEMTKEYYLKTIVYLLLLIAKFLEPTAISHRKMLVRYVTLGKIRLIQLPAALSYLRKTGNGIIEQEEFERACGIGNWEEMFAHVLWKEKHARREILREGEAERKKRQEEARLQKLKEEEEKKKQEEDEKKEKERERLLKEQVEKAEREAIEKAKSEKLKKLQEERKKEDESIKEERRKIDIAREKLKEKKEQERKQQKKEREQELAKVEADIKKKQQELRDRKEERIRQQRAEARRRENERMVRIKEMQYSVS